MIDETLLLEIVDNQHWTFPLHYPLVLDSKLVQSDKIQLYLRLTQFINQDGKCLCQKELGNNFELHHALITRRDAMGLFDPSLVHSSFNTVLLHHSCHERIRRSLCLIYLADTFGLSNVQKWYQDIKSQMEGLRSVEAIFLDKFLPE